MPLCRSVRHPETSGYFLHLQQYFYRHFVDKSKFEQYIEAFCSRSEHCQGTVPKERDADSFGTMRLRVGLLHIIMPKFRASRYFGIFGQGWFLVSALRDMERKKGAEPRTEFLWCEVNLRCRLFGIAKRTRIRPEGTGCRFVRHKEGEFVPKPSG